ncbi:MAG: serine hydrolase [Thermodesulfobacteriota bacterium]|nr:serine hydrolase [Thermodesulfobacteriota bacterium]
MQPVDTLMHQGISDKVFPGAVLLISQNDSILFSKAYGYANIFSKRPMTEDTIFDLASLTKPLATTLAIMNLVAENKLDVDQSLGSVLSRFSKTEKQHIKIRHLLSHTSGLPDYRPYYKELAKLPLGSRKDALMDLIAGEPLIDQIGEKELYSDLGFMILRHVAEHLSGKQLGTFVEQTVYQTLAPDVGRGLFFNHTDGKLRPGRYAATEFCRWRNMVLAGVVHDENAYVMGGVDGHAGLFGTAECIFKLLSTLLHAYHGFSSNQVFTKDLLKVFFNRQGNTEKTLGFDTPSLQHASCGDFFPKKSVGHLGFTGTSFWMDLERSVIVILLTNRIHPSRDNTKIKAFRPEIHNTIMKSL